MENKYVGHPTIDYATFEAFPMIVFGHKCISEDYQDGEIWSDDEYWGSTLYDFDDDKYYKSGFYQQGAENWERLLTNWKQKEEDPSDGSISEDFEEYDQDAIDFYKHYLNSESTLKLDEYYKKVYMSKEELEKRIDKLTDETIELWHQSFDMSPKEGAKWYHNHPKVKELVKLEREYKLVKDYKLTDFDPECGDLMSIESFISGCMNGPLFTNSDGFGYYATKDKESDIEVYPSDIISGVYRKDFKYIVWYNR